MAVSIPSGCASSGRWRCKRKWVSISFLLFAPGGSVLTIDVVIAMALGLAGLACLFGAWHNHIAAHWRPVPAGWVLLLVSGWFWVAGTGAEFGISLLLLVTSLIAWLFVAANRSQRPRRGGGETGPPKPNADPQPWSRHALLLLLAVPGAAVASALLAVALSMALPVAVVNAMVTVIVVMPVLWGCAAYWVCADSRLVRPAAAMVLSAAVGAAVIYA